MQNPAVNVGPLPVINRVRNFLTTYKQRLKHLLAPTDSEELTVSNLKFQEQY